MRVRDCVVGCMVKCSDDALLYGSLHYQQATLSRKMPGEGGACRNSVVESKLK